MRTFHANWAFVVVVVNIAAGVWGLVAAQRKMSVPRAFWALVIAGQGALAVQVSLGVLMMERVRPSGQHVFYGFMLMFVGVLAWAFRGDSQRRAVATMSAVALFLGVVAIRAMTTG